MKIFIKLLVLLLMLACAAPFFIKGPDGQSLMNVNEIKFPKLSMPSFDGLKNQLRVFNNEQHIALDANRDGLQVYKWRDEKGVVHYSDRAFAGKTSKLSRIEDITILPANSKSNSLNRQARLDGNGFQGPSPTTISLGQMPKLIKDAKQIEQLLKDRKQRQDAAIDAMP